ncbi:MAG: carbon storage regulator CsrA [Planctomyces sp.]|nr:carbon storage regulator CsrA [Planctomyces sp.]
MLVLSRKKNESIIIADSVRITVVEIRGDKVRLGIEAPRDVPVHRTEVYEQLQRMKAEDEARAAVDNPVESQPSS